MNNKVLNYIKAIILILSFMLLIIYNYNPDVQSRNIKTPAEPNYLGMAKMGLIPTSDICTHDPSLYYSTNVIAKDNSGKQYVIMQSKLGDESCLFKIK